MLRSFLLCLLSHLPLPDLSAHWNMQGALFTTPLPLSLLAPSDRRCSICLEPYIEPAKHDPACEDGEGEWAVRVDLVAEISELRRCCGHVIGKQCLEAHLRSSGPWKRQCPLCRDVWFRECNRPVDGARRSSTLQAQRSTERLARSRSHSTNDTSGNGFRSPRISRDQRQTLRQNRLSERAGFTQRVREKLEIEDGSDEVGRSLEEVEQALKDFYGWSEVSSR